MRLGVSTSLDMSSATAWAQAQAELGCRSVVFPLNCEASADEVAAYAAAARDKDILIAEVGVWRNVLASDSKEREANMEYCIGQLRLAEQVGARCAVNVAGALGSRWDGGYRANFSKEAWDATVASVREIIDGAGVKNTFFALEPMPWMIPSGPEEYLRLIDDVNRDRFAVHMDIINLMNSAERYFFRDEFLTKCFKLLGDRIKSCHIKDVKLLDGYTFQLKESACGDGDFNLELYAELANEIDPDMPMIIEHLADDDAYRKSFKYVSERLAGYCIPEEEMQ